MYRFLGICLLGVLLGVVGAMPVSAQGFGVYEQGACMAGRGGAGVADPCPDGSGMFFNPAALSMDAKVMTLGSVLIGPRGDFTDTSSTSSKGTVSTLNNHWYPVPNIYVSMPFAKKYAFGVGVMAPYGLTTDWPATSQGRFLGYKSVVQGLYVQPTFAAKLNDKVSVGFGIDATYLNVELNQRADLSTQVLTVHPVYGTLTFAQLNLVCPASVCGTVPAGTDFADIQLKGNSWHAGYHLGLMIKANERFSIGMRYLSGQKVDIASGTIATEQISVPGVKVPVTTPGGVVFVPVDQALKPQFDSGGKLSDQTATTSMPLPAQFVAGVMIKASSNVKLFADYQYSNWAKFDVLVIDGQYLDSKVVESYRNVSGFRMGTEIGLGEKNALRAGFNVHGPAAPDQTVTPNLPEGSRREIMLGFGSQLSKRFRLDLSYMYLGQPDREGRTNAGKNPEAPVPSDNNGIYSFMAHLLGLSMSVRF
jgi:long-chain fatty acid transport protein